MAQISEPPHTTQEGRPSGKDPIRAKGRLQVSWVVLPMAIILVLIVVFGIKAVA